MIGPSQSIICCLTSTAIGAAACTTSSRLERSNAARSASGQLQHPDEHGRHELAVGDPVALDERQRLAGSNRSITIAVPPLRIVPSDQPIGAPW